MIFLASKLWFHAKRSYMKFLTHHSSNSALGAVSLIATRLRLAHEGSKRASSGGKRLPLGQGGRAADLVSLAVDEMALLVKMVVHAGVNRSEFL